MTALIRVVTALLLTLAALPALAQNTTPKPAPIPTPTGTLEERLEAQLEAWQEHRQQRIEVREIKGIGGGEDVNESRESLEQRYKTLLTKRWSNREWRDYWEKEGAFARAVADLYEQLVPGDGTGRLATKLADDTRRLTEQNQQLQQAKDRVAALKLAQATAENSLRGTIAADKEAFTVLEAGLAELKATADASGQALAKLDRELQRLQESPAPEAGTPEETERNIAIAQAKQARDAAQIQAEADQKAFQEAEAKLEANRAAVGYIEALLDPNTPTPPNAPAGLEPQLAEHIKTLGEAPLQIITAEGELETLQTTVDALSESIGKTGIEIDQYEHRIKTLRAWSELAASKVDNQDVYYAALDADISAVKERLRDFEGPPEEHIKPSERICEGPRAEKSIEHYYECADAIKKELAELERQLESHTASLELANVQRKSIEQLIQAQERDIDLVQRELSIASNEVNHLLRKGHYRPSQRAEILDSAERNLLAYDDWTGIWVVYQERASSKTTKLKEALITSKITRRTLKVNIDFFETEIKNLSDKIPATEAYLEARTRARIFFGALLSSIWNFIKRAWPIPFYILIAWFLLWLSKRITRKIVEEIKEEADNQDERQRVETIGTVARGAIKLVVLVATFLIVLDALGVDIGPILGGAAIFGLAISFGSQNLVKDVVTGFFILLENQYAVGDIVEIGGKAGTVENVTLRRTVLRDMQGRVHNIANGSIGTVSNMSQGWSRVVIHVGVSYGSNLELVQKTVDGIGDELYADPEWATKLTEPPRYIGLISFDDSSLKVRIMFKTTIFENWAAEREFNRRIKLAFDQAGIEIPFPQRDIHIIRGAELTEEERRVVDGQRAQGD